jgi:hypothetical protein
VADDAPPPPAADEDDDPSPLDDDEADPPPAEEDDELPSPLDDAEAPPLPALLLLLPPPPLLEDEAPPFPELDEDVDDPPDDAPRRGAPKGTAPPSPSSAAPAAATTPATGVQITPGGRIHFSSGITTPCDSAQQKTFTSFGLSATQPASSTLAAAEKKTGDQGMKGRRNMWLQVPLMLNVFRLATGDTTLSDRMVLPSGWSSRLSVDSCAGRSKPRPARKASPPARRDTQPARRGVFDAPIGQGGGLRPESDQAKVEGRESGRFPASVQPSGTGNRVPT